MTSRLNAPSTQGLSKIQENFDFYQKSAFPPRDPQFFALELAGECGECANVEKKIWREPSRLGELEGDLSMEVADVFIALMNYCNSRKVNLEAAVAKKLLIIEDRRIHGKMGSTL